MAKYLDFFDDVYYINLDSRVDRKEKFESLSKDVGINAIRFSAITPNENDDEYQYQPLEKFRVGCTMSHQAVVRLAKERNLDNVLIFEDDCVFLDGFETELKKYVQELKNFEWDLFYLGGSPTDYCEKISDNLYSCPGMYGAHAYVVNNNFYDKILSLTPFYIIDMAYISLKDSKYLLGKNILTIQGEGWSDLFNYYKNYESAIIEIKRWKDMVEFQDEHKNNLKE